MTPHELTHKRRGIKLGHNYFTATHQKKILTERMFEAGEIAEMLNTYYKKPSGSQP